MPRFSAPATAPAGAVPEGAAPEGAALAASAVPGGSGRPPDGERPGRTVRSRNSVLAFALLLLAVAAGTVVLLAVFAAPYADAAGGCGGG